MNEIVKIPLSERIERLRRVKDQPLDEKLEALRKFGMPRLGFYDSGWSCSVEMFVSGEGCNFKVRSESGMKTTHEAVDQCAERVIETMKQYA